MSPKRLPTAKELARRLVTQAEPHPWWVMAMAECLRKGWVELIPAHTDPTRLYLVRAWLHVPVPGLHGWESAESCLLHWFHLPDQDAALHDHPWDFETTVLEGGYVECEPEREWSPEISQLDNYTAAKGPQYNVAGRLMVAGMSRSHKATDLHRIAVICPNTFTLVRTGKRTRLWGFFPPGFPWVEANAYLRTGAKPTQTTPARVSA